MCGAALLGGCFLVSPITLNAQTRIPTRLEILRNPDGSAGGTLRLYNSAGTFYGDITVPATANRAYVLQDSSYTVAGINITQTFTQDQTHAANILMDNNTRYIQWPSGALVRSSDIQLYGGGVRRAELQGGGPFGSGYARFYNTAGDRFWGFAAATATTGTSTQWELPTVDGSLGQAMVTNGSAVLYFTSVMTNPLTVTGDMIYNSGGTTPARLGIGSTDNCILVASGLPSWSSRCLLTDTTQTITGTKTFAANILMNTNADYIQWPSGAILRSSDIQIFGGGVKRAELQGGGTFGSGYARFQNTAGDRFWGLKAATATTGTSTEWTLPTADGTSGQALVTDGGAVLSFTSFVPTSRTISTTSPLGGGGDLSANRTITCTTCVTNVTGTSPISSSGGTTPAISCSTCVTTAGGQSIAGTTTLSTLSLSTTLTGNASIAPSGTGSYFDTSYNTGGGNPYRLRGAALIDNGGVWVSAGGINMNAGIGATSFNIYGGATGVTSTTCSQFTAGICTAP